MRTGGELEAIVSTHTKSMQACGQVKMGGHGHCDMLGTAGSDIREHNIASEEPLVHGIAAIIDDAGFRKGAVAIRTCCIIYIGQTCIHINEQATDLVFSPGRVVAENEILAGV